MNSASPRHHARGGDPAHEDRPTESASEQSGAGFSALSQFSDILPAGTSDAWRRLAPMLPDTAYLVGGTALAIHLKHRVSRDLDFFTEQPFNAETYASGMADRFDDFGATRIDAGTVNGLLGDTKVQLLDASTQKNLVEPTPLAGVRVASVEDILATKLKVVMDRGELRDYFDLMCIEQQTALDAVIGVHLYLERYSPTVPGQHVYQIVKSLGFFDDVEDDPGLPMPKAEVAQYWARRQPQIARRLQTH